MVLSPRFKHALKTALAVVIAYAIALYMDWDKPIWAGYTAASVSLDATGQSIQKGLNRIVGALVGSIAGFILLAFFIQDRWLFFMFLSLYVAVCTYFSFGTEPEPGLPSKRAMLLPKSAFMPAVNCRPAFSRLLRESVGQSSRPTSM